MSRTAAKFTQADIARALRATAQFETKFDVVLEPTGTIRIVPSEGKPKKPLDLADSIRL